MNSMHVYITSGCRSGPQEKIGIKTGLPQGSLNAPQLFCEYIDDLVYLLNKITNSVYLYADDIAIICKGIKELEEILIILDNWCTINDMKIN